jgi:hypothetical protein
MSFQLRMLRLGPIASVCLFALVPLQAPAADPLKSEACGERLAALESARKQGNAQVEALRQQATRACLGGGGEARRPSPTAQAPVAVPAPVITALPAQPVPPRPPSPPMEPPPVVTSCDLGGCWDSNGTRLNRAGPQLIGPRGACTTVGATVYCP